MTLIASQQSLGGNEPDFRISSRACAALESGELLKASRHDEPSFFATASKESIGPAASATKPGHRSLNGTHSGADGAPL